MNGPSDADMTRAGEWAEPARRMRIDDTVAIVTGAGGAIGGAAARLLAVAGSSVLVVDVDAQAAAATVKRIDLDGGSAAACIADVSTSDGIACIIDAALSKFGSVDILVNNAGIAGINKTVWETDLEEWRKVLRINLDGPFICCKAIVPSMVKQNYGRIVNIASIAGKEGNPNAAAYSAAKAGVIGLTKSLAKEVATKGVIINGITPAVIATEILKQVSAEHVNYMTSRIPMGRVGQPEEVAALAAFLASGEVTFSTGAIFDLSGGRATY